MDLREQLIEQRNELAAAMKATCDDAAKESRDLTEAEDKNLTDMQAKLEKLDARIEQLTEIAVRAAKAAEVQARVEPQPVTAKVTREADIYRPDGDHSFFRDLIEARTNDDAKERLIRSTGTSAMGAVIPPRYLLDELVELQRYGRPVANVLPRAGDPSGWLTTYVPKVDTGLQVNWYTEGSAVQDSDAAINSNVQVNSRTIAGKTDVNIRLLETSGVAYDRFIWSELSAEYALKVEDFVLNSSTASAKGILQVSGTNLVTYTSASPTVAELYGKVGEAKSRVFTNRKRPATHLIMSPDKAEWILSRSDTTGRPMQAPVAPQNAPGGFQVTATEGYNFSFAGVPVLVSGTMPENVATPAEEGIIVARLADAMFWEGTPKFNIFEDVLSGTMQVRFRMHNNVAVTFERFPKSISVIKGTGVGNIGF